MKHWLQYLPHLFGVYVFKRVCDYVIKKTESIAANSTAELLRWGFKRLFKGNQTMLSKTLYSGPNGSVSVSESGGVVTLSASLSGQAGGGSAKGVVSASVSASVSIGAEQIADMGLDVAAAKFPALKAEIDLVKAALAAELAK